MPPVPAHVSKKRKMSQPFTLNQVKALNRMSAKTVAKLRDGRLAYQNVSSNTLHGNHYVFNPMWPISQGTNNNQRLGSELFVDGFLINCLLELPATTSLAGSVTFRLRVYADHDNAFSGAGLSTVVQQVNMQSVGFLGVGNSTTMLNDKWQVRCLMDELVTLDFQVAAGRYQKHVRKWIPIKKKVTYDTAGFLKLENYYCVVSPWIGNGTLNTTATGFFEWNTGVYFKE